MTKYRQYVPKRREKYPYPSRFGSHSSMIDEEKTKALDDESKVVIQDEHGHYTTDKSRLDDGLADYKRCVPSRLTWCKKDA